MILTYTGGYEHPQVIEFARGIAKQPSYLGQDYLFFPSAYREYKLVIGSGIDFDSLTFTDCTVHTFTWQEDGNNKHYFFQTTAYNVSDTVDNSSHCVLYGSGKDCVSFFDPIVPAVGTVFLVAVAVANSLFLGWTIIRVLKRHKGG